MIRIQTCRELLRIKKYIYGNNNWIASDVIFLSKGRLKDNNVIGTKVIINNSYDSENVVRIKDEYIIDKINYVGEKI